MNISTHDFKNAKIGLFSAAIIYSNFSLLASDDEDFEIDPLDEDDDIISDSENSNASRYMKQKILSRRIFLP